MSEKIASIKRKRHGVVPRKIEMNIKKMFVLADVAKTIGQGQDYSLANAVFCFILQAIYGPGGENLQKTIKVGLETEDEAGDCHAQSYYDLVVLTCYTSEEFKDGVELSIPIPVLSPAVAVDLVKKAYSAGAVFGRTQHQRKYRPANEDEMQELWEEFSQESGIKDLEILVLVNRFLTTEALTKNGFQVL